LGFFLFIVKRNTRLYNVVEVSQLNYYQTTTLEDWVTTKYVKYKIMKPSEINIQYIARIFGIYINQTALPSTHLILGRSRVIYLEKGISMEQKREAFFHEFCHIQRHAGVQSNMPNPFRELQEWDARRFTLYAALPSHMIQFIPFDEPDCIEETARIFRVTPELCEERLEQIQRRYSNTKYIAERMQSYGI
jgi:hypothetical protein